MKFERTKSMPKKSEELTVYGISKLDKAIVALQKYIEESKKFQRETLELAIEGLEKGTHVQSNKK